MTLLRLPEVMRKSGYSRSMVYDLIAKGLYPKPIKISERAVAWRSHEVEAMMSAVIAQKTLDERRGLVRRLEGDRAVLRPEISKEG